MLSVKDVYTCHAQLIYKLTLFRACFRKENILVKEGSDSAQECSHQGRLRLLWALLLRFRVFSPRERLFPDVGDQVLETKTSVPNTAF